MKANTLFMLVYLPILACQPDTIEHPLTAPKSVQKNPNHNTNGSVSSEVFSRKLSNHIDSIYVDYSLGEYDPSKESDSILIKLNTLACQTDGELADRMAMITASIYQKNEAFFFKHLFDYKLTCLENLFIYEMNQDVAQFAGKEREAHLTQKRRQLQQLSGKLTQSQMDNARRVIARIRPEDVE
jgi:hypothetical protein